MHTITISKITDIWPTKMDREDNRVDRIRVANRAHTKINGVDIIKGIISKTIMAKEVVGIAMVEIAGIVTVEEVEIITVADITLTIALMGIIIIMEVAVGVEVEVVTTIIITITLLIAEAINRGWTQTTRANITIGTSSTVSNNTTMETTT